jgi:DNA-binding response OmpR family regulator/HPt (histidine-containing phosphotransfer) domain-containing protein
MKILVIDDDELIAQTLSILLGSQNYAVEVATEGQMGLELLEAFDYDLVMLDVMLPKQDGISICRRIRAKGLQMPILLLTGIDSSHDKAIGLDAGADDYVVKPFDPEELVARVRALLRRSGASAQPLLTWGDLCLDPSSCEVTYGTQSLALTPKEYSLLELFMRNSRRVFSCSMILEHVWTYDETPSEEAVRTHIKGLRQKLKAVGLPSDVVETVYGIGYRLKSQEPEPKTEPQPKQLNLPQKSTQVEQKTLASISQVWHRFKDHISDQVGLLEQAVIALWQKELDQELRQQARREAHTLAGALGTFGLPEGSRLAHQIEHLFQVESPLSEDEMVNLRDWVMSLRHEVERSRQGSEEASSSVSESAVKPPIEGHCSLLWMVDGDRSLTRQIATEAANWNFQIETFSSLTQVRKRLLQTSPNVILLDPAISDEPSESLSLLTEFSKHVPPIPVVIHEEHPDLKERLEIARLGGHTFLQKPAAPTQVLEAVKQTLIQTDQAKSQVMVVDDDPVLLEVVRSLLEPWGLKITTLTNPQQFWQVLEATAPDILILDIEMPQVSGIELCQIVRNDAYWSDLPILFLTAHTDSDTVNQVFSVGADDFVCKPIVGPELVTRIINRLDRSRLSRRLTKVMQSSVKAPDIL